MALVNLWVVFLPGPNDNGIFLQGIYLNEADAVLHCRRQEGIALVAVGEPLPLEVIDALKLYYPHQDGIWQNSILYRYKQKATAVIDQFFRKSPCP